MKITIQEKTVLLEVDSHELATINCALGSYLSLAKNPRDWHDRATVDDITVAERLEKESFQAWCELDVPSLVQVGSNKGPQRLA
jgi:hypothetical protein